MLSPALGFSRYIILTALNGCPRCSGAISEGTCIMCGWDGPTRAPSLAERREYTERLRGRGPTHGHGGVANRSLRGQAVARG
jgi:hypothetical protein